MRAIADYDMAIQLEPSAVNAFYGRGNVYAKLRDYNRAIGDYNQVIILQPQNADALYERGVAKQKNGDKSGGRADISAAKRMKPGVEK